MRYLLLLSSLGVLAAANSCCTQTTTVTSPPCRPGTAGKECPEYVPPKEPCTRTRPATTVTVPPKGLCESVSMETVTVRCEGLTCPQPCRTVDGDVVTVTACPV